LFGREAKPTAWIKGLAGILTSILGLSFATGTLSWLGFMVGGH
jgi:hypothetical protein